jgi:hypothetical protein
MLTTCSRAAALSSEASATQIAYASGLNSGSPGKHVAHGLVEHLLLSFQCLYKSLGLSFGLTKVCDRTGRKPGQNESASGDARIEAHSP